MMNVYRVIVVFATIFLFCVPFAEGKEASQDTAWVTLVEGTARVSSKRAPAGRLLKKGDRLKKNDIVNVAERSRIEIRFSDGTIMRLAEKSSLKMNDYLFDKKTEHKKINVNLSAGKIWATVRKLVTPESSVVVETSNAVAGVRGTVYRLNVEEDRSVQVKVYQGSVYVANPPKPAARPSEHVGKPREVPGPHEVPPPYHEVTMHEWTVIVKAMQQVDVSSRGVATEPRTFDPKDDADAWVLWNQERDQELKRSQ